MRKRFYSYYETLGNFGFQLVRDLFRSKDVLFLEMMLGLGVYILLARCVRVRHRVAATIWNGALLAIPVLVGLAVMARYEYLRTISEKCLFGVDRYHCGRPFSLVYSVVCYSLIGVAVIYLLYLGYLFNKIQLVIELFKEITDFTSTFERMELLPFLMSLLPIGFLAFGLMILAFNMSVATLGLVSAKYIQGGKTKLFTYDTSTIFYTFIPAIYLFWLVIRVGLNCARFVTTFAITEWFFKKKKHSIRIRISTGVTACFCNHLGSIVMLSVLETTLFPFKSILGAISRFLVRNGEGCAKCLQYLLFPCVFFNFKLARYIDPRALVFMSLFGDSYSTASQKAFFLLEKRSKKRNHGPINLVKTTLDLLRFSVSLLVALVYLVRYKFAPKNVFLEETGDIYYPFVVGSVLFWLSFCSLKVVRGAVLQVYQTVVTCYFIDEEMFVTTQKFSENLLVKIKPFFDIYGRKVEYYKKSERQASMRFFESLFIQNIYIQVFYFIIVIKIFSFIVFILSLSVT